MSNVSTQTCGACGKPFASWMTYCPHCKTDVPGAKRQDSRAGVILVAIVVIAGIAGAALKMAGMF